VDEAQASLERANDRAVLGAWIRNYLGVSNAEKNKA